MSKTRQWLVAILAGMALLGCESVNSRHILGERISDDLSEQLNGAWKINGDVAHIHQVAPGELRIAGLEWDDAAAKFETIELSVIISRLGEQGFFNLVRPDDPEDPGDDAEGTWYQYLTYELGEDSLTIRGTATEPFAKAVGEGKLAGRADIQRDAQGKVQERHVWLEADKQAIEAFIRDGKVEELFADSETLHRIRDDD